MTSEVSIERLGVRSRFVPGSRSSQGYDLRLRIDRPSLEEPSLFFGRFESDVTTLIIEKSAERRSFHRNPCFGTVSRLPIIRNRRSISVARRSVIGDISADTALFHRRGVMQSFAVLINPPWRSRFRIFSSGHAWSPSSRNDADSPGKSVRRFRSTVAFGSIRATST